MGLAYFLCSVGTMYYYFWPKFFLLIQGFDLDKNYQLTNPKAPKNGAPGALGEKSGDATVGTFDSKEEEVRQDGPLTRWHTSSPTCSPTHARSPVPTHIPIPTPCLPCMQIKRRHFHKMPKTMEECKILYEMLAKQNMILTQKVRRARPLP